MNQRQHETSNVLINFGFEEVNEAIIRNTQIWRYKKVLGGKEKIVVLVPEVFAGLYFHADKIITFGLTGIKQYSEASDFSPGKTVLRWYAFLERMHRVFYKFKMTRNASYYLFRRTPRQDRYFIKNGVEKRLLALCREKLGAFNYIRMSDYYDLSLMEPVSPDLRQWFVTNLEYMQQMISAGDVYRVQQKNRDSERPLVVLRTRNFRNKAVVHNSKKHVLAPLIAELLKYNCDVLNIGTPHLPLDIVHANYKELTHSMSIEEEFDLCGNASCTIMTTEAGNFMGFSATDVRIVQYDDEVFEPLFKSPLSLFRARRAAGLDDLDIRGQVQAELWSNAARSIYEFAAAERKVSDKSTPTSIEKIHVALL